MASGSRINYINVTDGTWRNLSIGSASGVSGTPRTESLGFDWDRRLLFLVGNETGTDGPRFRVADLSTVANNTDPDAILVSGTGGWKDVMLGTNWPFTSPYTGNYISNYYVPFQYYPPNGKYYRFISQIVGGDPRGGSNPHPTINEAQYWASVTNNSHNKLQRITPPPIIPNPPAGYYTTSTNWSIDEITLSNHMSRGSLAYQFQAVSNKWFKYIPALELFAWCPLNNGGGEPTARRPVYLIKPY